MSYQKEIHFSPLNKNNNLSFNEHNVNNLDDEDNKSGSDIETQTNTYPLKITLVGNSSVGKTSIVKRYFENIFINNAEATINAMYYNKKTKVDAFTEAELQVWDTMGQEKYRSLTRNYLINANGILVVFDLSDEKSFDDLNFWLEEINTVVDDKNVIKILVGNKSDITDKKIDNQKVLNYANQHNMRYLNVSAKDGVNIEYLFEIIGIECVKKIKDKQKEIEEEDLDKNNNEKSKSIDLSLKENDLSNKKSKKCC